MWGTQDLLGVRRFRGWATTGSTSRRSGRRKSDGCLRLSLGVLFAVLLFGSDMGGLIDKLEAYRHEPEG
jgi:hypothetical protein